MSALASVGVGLGEAMALAAAICWAAAVVLFKRSSETMPPLALNLFKNLIGLFLLCVTLPLVSQPFFPPVGARTWTLLLLSGVIGLAVADALFFAALTRLGAGMTAVVDTTYTPIVLSMSAVWLGDRLGGFEVAGAVLIMGALLVGGATLPAPGRDRRQLWMGGLLGVSALFLMALGVVIIKAELDQVPLLWATWARMVSGTAVCGILVVLHPRRRALLASVFRPSPAWRTAVPAAVLGTYLAMIFWLGGMKYTAVSRAALLNQLSTVFIFLLARAVLNEPITRRRAGAIVLASLGGALVAAQGLF